MSSQEERASATARERQHTESYWRSRLEPEIRAGIVEGLEKYLAGYLEDYLDVEEVRDFAKATKAAFETAIEIANGKSFPTNSERAIVKGGTK